MHLDFPRFSRPALPGYVCDPDSNSVKALPDSRSAGETHPEHYTP